MEPDNLRVTIDLSRDEYELVRRRVLRSMRTVAEHDIVEQLCGSRLCSRIRGRSDYHIKK